MDPLDYFFYPKSIAVVGATDDPNKLGHELTTNIIQTINKIHESDRPILYLVHPSKERINNIACYQQLSRVPKPPDLTLVAVPAKHVLSILQECAEIGTKGVIIITAGFGEIDQKGKEMEQQFLKIANKGNFRIVGPNCVGLINMDLPLNASFVKTPPHGFISLISQSGSFGAANIYRMHSMGIGIQKFINLGNAIDVQPHEILEYLSRDQNTEAIGMYLETLQNGRLFYDVSRRITKQKPIIVLKAGRTHEGQKSASSHTGALATDYRIFTGMAKQARIHLVSEEVEFQAALSVLGLGNRESTGCKVGIITNAGGPAVILTDLISEYGITIANLGKMPEQLKKQLNPLVKWTNPLDLIATARKKDYHAATLALLENQNVDLLVVLCVVPTFLRMTPTEHAEGVINAIREFKDRHSQKKPVIMGWLAGKIAEESRYLAVSEGIPFFTSIKEVASAVKALNYHIIKKNKASPS